MDLLNWKSPCDVSNYVKNFVAFSEESMGSEESVGSVELKKILDSFEAGEVLPEVRPLCFRIQNKVLFYV